MLPDRHALARELPPMVRLAVPVVAAELGWMAMGVVDVVMLGRVGATAIGGASVGRALFIFVAVAGIGMLLGLDTVVSQAWGAGRREECRVALAQGVLLAVALGIPLTWLVRALAGLMTWGGVDGRVLEEAVPYVRAVSLSSLPVFLYTALRRYFQGIGVVRPIAWAVISANALNAVANWILIFGHAGAPAMGAAGAGWATTISMTYMALFLIVAASVHARASALPALAWRLHAATMRRLIALGLPAASQLVLEVGVFALATLLAGKLAPAALAAHQIALTAASVTFMVPLGISSAAAVRVGHGLGRGEPHASAVSGWAGLMLGGGFMLLAALVFVLLPHTVVRFFTTDDAVIPSGVALLFIAAVFQLFDGLQIVATGALRGAGDTRSSMLTSLVGYWALGLPVAYWLCFSAGWGVRGLWTGLSAGLIFVALVLLACWSRLVRRWQRGTAPLAG